MKISQNHPLVSKFKFNEVQSIGKIMQSGLLNNFVDLNSSIEQSYYNYKNYKEKNLKTIDLNFHWSFNIDVQGAAKQIYIGAQINDDYNPATYFFAITDTGKKRLLRKFHFDFANPSIPTNCPVPIYHLQYGGEMTPKMIEDQIEHEHLDTWLSVPRLAIAPVNITLLLDLLLNEIQTEETIKIVEDSYWRGLVYKNEEFLFQPYYTSISNFFSGNRHSASLLVRDFLYGK
jgi:hypothetical protein